MFSKQILPIFAAVAGLASGTIIYPKVGLLLLDYVTTY